MRKSNHTKEFIAFVLIQAEFVECILNFAENSALKSRRFTVENLSATE